MKILRIASLLLLASLVWTSCVKENEAFTNRGQLVSATLLESFTTAELDSVKQNIDPSGQLNLIANNYGVNVYRVVYKTIDTKGRGIEASGALVVPMNVIGAMPLASYQHGTIASDDSAPSNLGYEIVIGYLLSSSNGFTVCMPDYLGFGASGDMRHPYVHAKSEASATIDMIRASRNFAKENPEYSLSKQLFLFGYSQGGHATMAALKEIEEQHLDEMAVTAAYPMAGPYDIGGVQADLLRSDAHYSNPFYLPYVVLSYNDVYGLYPNVSDFLKEPYATDFPQYFEGNPGSSNAVDAMMPYIPNQIIRDEVLADFTANPTTHPFGRALNDNNLWEWRPITPMRLCQCNGDEQVAPANARVAQNSFRNYGRNDITLLIPDNNAAPMSHPDCALPCLIDGLSWFVSLKQ